MLTRAVFSDECQTISLGQCTIFGARFSPVPHYHMISNMFTARCEYVKQELIPPKDFATQMNALVEYAVQANSTTVPKPTPFQIKQQYFVGLGRFAMEHWLGSHPSLVRPCDVYNNSKHHHSYSNLLHPLWDRWKPRLQSAPWMSLDITFPSVQGGEWFCGPARLLEFAFLYDGQAPPPDSFLWRYYVEASRDCPVAISSKG